MLSAVYQKPFRGLNKDRRAWENDLRGFVEIVYHEKKGPGDRCPIHGDFAQPTEGLLISFKTTEIFIQPPEISLNIT